MHILRADGKLSGCELPASDASVADLITPSLRKALAAASAQLPGANVLMVTVAAFPDPAGAVLLAGVHVVARPAQAACPVSVGVLGPPRPSPRAKHSAWISDRAWLEAARPPSCAEVILSSCCGSLLLEGLVTNLFVVVATAHADPEAATPAGGETLAVQTAAVEQGILAGIKRAAVLRACREGGIPVLLDAPRVADSSCW